MSPLPLEAFSFTMTGAEAAPVFSFLEKHGHEKSSQGLKNYLLDVVKKTPSPEPETFTVEEESTGGEPDMELGEGLQRILGAVQRNPEAMDFIKKKGARLSRSLLKRLFD